MTELENLAYAFIALIVLLFAGIGLIWAVVEWMVWFTMKPERRSIQEAERRGLLLWGIRTGKPKEEIDAVRRARL